MYAVIEEVVYCVKDWTQLNSNNGDTTTLQQSLVLLKFGHIFDVQDFQYWRCARSIAQKCLYREKSRLDIDPLLKAAMHLMTYDFLSNKILRLVHETRKDITKMTPLQLGFYTQLLVCEDMENLMDTSECYPRI